MLVVIYPHGGLRRISSQLLSSVAMEEGSKERIGWFQDFAKVEEVLVVKCQVLEAKVFLQNNLVTL